MKVQYVYKSLIKQQQAKICSRIGSCKMVGTSVCWFYLIKLLELIKTEKNKTVCTIFPRIFYHDGDIAIQYLIECIIEAIERPEWIWILSEMNLIAV